MRIRSIGDRKLGNRARVWLVSMQMAAGARASCLVRSTVLLPIQEKCDAPVLPVMVELGLVVRHRQRIDCSPLNKAYKKDLA